jgi:phosphatidylcholine synthase
MASGAAPERADGAEFKRAMLQAASWAVHFYTASGGALGLMAIYFAAERNLRASFMAMAIAIFVDATDGTFARALDVKARTPRFDGALLDNIIDYLTFVAAPVFLMLRIGIIADSVGGLALACFVMIAAGYGFCQADAKTDDHYFLGWPNYWNIAAFYLYCMNLSAVANATIITILAIMVFVPIKYIYPSRTVALRTISIAWGIVWGIVTTAMIPMLPAVNPIMLAVSLSYITYYFIASFALNFADARRAATH